MQVPRNVQGPNNNRYPSSIPRSTPIPRPFSFEPRPTLPGFYVNSEEEIRPGDAEMDGSISFFPYRDLSKIVIRQWSNNGQLESLTYLLQQPNSEQRSVQNPIPIPPPMEQQGSQLQQTEKDNAIMESLNHLNQGLSQTFSQFATVLQSMQESMARIEQNISKDNGIG